MHSLFCKVVDFIAALGAVHVGLVALGYHVPAMIGLPAHVISILQYVIGIAGVIALIMVFACRDKCDVR